MSASNMDFFRIYRDDGLLIHLGNSDEIKNLLNLFNEFDPDIKWTCPECPCGCGLDSFLCKNSQEIEFLDCKLSLYQVQKTSNQRIWQIKMKPFYKTTDVHSYLHPKSCTSPHLNSFGVSQAKTIGTRLRGICSDDLDLLQAFNEYAGFLKSRGYSEYSIKYHLCQMGNKNRNSVLETPQTNPKMVFPLVTNLHPTLYCLRTMLKKFSSNLFADPIMKRLFENKMLLSYRKLPNLQTIIAQPQRQHLNFSLSSNLGYIPSGDNCQVCRASSFGRLVKPLSIPQFSVRIPATVTCQTKNCIYYLKCKGSLLSCKKAHYVGSTENIKKRFANHKSHIKRKKVFCNATGHFIKHHPNIDPEELLEITILESDISSNLNKLEDKWRWNLLTWFPFGLNTREN